MAHFALLADDNTVIRVEVVHNNDAPTEEAGIAFMRSIYGKDTRWIQTSFNGSMRKNFAGIGHTYDQARDAFVAPKPFESWALDEARAQWRAPKGMPVGETKLKWDEKTLDWVKS